MFMRISIGLAIVAMIAGVFISVASGVPAIGKVLAAPFCEEVDTSNFGMTLTCVNGRDERELTELFIMVGTGTIIAGSLLLTFGLVGGLMMTSAKLDRIVKYGEPAQALILNMQATGVRVNSQPMIKFSLQVTPSYDAPYEAETNRIIPFGMMGRLAIGMTVPVKYDPKKPSDVALDFASMQITPMNFGGNFQMPQAAPQATSLADKLRELEESYKAGLITQSEYEAARQRIINGV